MTSQGCRGFTLIELLVVVAIATTLALMSIGGLSAAFKHSNEFTAVQKIVTTLDRARSLSVIRGQRVVICTMDIAGNCDSTWSGGDLAVFVDIDEDRQHDANEEIVYQQAWDSRNIHLSWNNWLKQPVVSYEPNGSVVSNGTLTLADNQNNPFKLIVISKPGRARIAAPY